MIIVHTGNKLSVPWVLESCRLAHIAKYLLYYLGKKFRTPGEILDLLAKYETNYDKKSFSKSFQVFLYYLEHKYIDSMGIG